MRVGDLEELREIAEAVVFIDGNRIRSMEELREAVKGDRAMEEKILPVAECTRILPEKAARPPVRKPAKARTNRKPGHGPAPVRREEPQQHREAPAPRPRKDDRSSHPAR